jgi:hypothetical protein
VEAADDYFEVYARDPVVSALGGPSHWTDPGKCMEQHGLYLVDPLYRILKYRYVLLDGSLVYK